MLFLSFVWFAVKSVLPGDDLARLLMELSIVITSKDSSWVDLPSSFLLSLASSLDSLPVPIALEVRRVASPHGSFFRSARPSATSPPLFLAWQGGNATRDGTLEVPRCVAECLGFREGERVEVRARSYESLAAADVVQVEPATVEDWEVLELNPGFLEARIQEQVHPRAASDGPAGSASTSWTPVSPDRLLIGGCHVNAKPTLRVP